MPTLRWCLLPILRGISAGKAIRNSHPLSRLTFQQLESAAFNNGSKSRQPGRKRNALLNRTWLAASPQARITGHRTESDLYEKTGVDNPGIKRCRVTPLHCTKTEGTPKMKTILLIASPLIFLAGAAFAASSDGVVARYNHDVRVITLENGRSYTVPRDVALPPLQAGEKVSIQLNGEGDRVTAVLKSR